MQSFLPFKYKCVFTRLGPCGKVDLSKGYWNLQRKLGINSQTQAPSGFLLVEFFCLDRFSRGNDGGRQNNFHTCTTGILQTCTLRGGCCCVLHKRVLLFGFTLM